MIYKGNLQWFKKKKKSLNRINGIQRIFWRKYEVSNMKIAEK